MMITGGGLGPGPSGAGHPATGSSSPSVSVPGFLSEVAAAEQQTPLPAPPAPSLDPNDPKYTGASEALGKDQQVTAEAVEQFRRAAHARGAAVAQVISKWLATSPLSMLQELLDRPRAEMPIFKPLIGPVVVMRHAHVITCLERTDLFTVDPYAGEMARATDDKTKNPQAFSHFLLGTDRDDLYRLDDVILRRAMSRRDAEALSVLCRHEAEFWTGKARDAGGGEIDAVATLAKFVPLRIVGDYIGISYHTRDEPSALPGLHGGDRFPLDDDLQRVFTFTRIQEGIVPTPDDLFGWVKDAFRNIFNNFSPLHPKFTEFRERGIVANEYLSAYVHALLKVHKARMRRGDVVPDTMLTRLLKMQLEVSDGNGHALEQACAALLGTPIPDGELAGRLSDSMIRSSVVGTSTGAIVNPQEASARIADAMLCLKDRVYEALEGSTYEQAARLANVDDGDPEYLESLSTLQKYALEALRLRPQGEVLLRLCVQDNTELGGILVRKGTPVFVGYAAAMRDPEVVPQPLAFNINRDPQLVGYLKDKERAHEAPQSLLYLQHGYGRHKCLGRYASEITMRESLRALLRLGRLERRSALEMDDQHLYATSLRVGFS